LAGNGGGLGALAFAGLAAGDVLAGSEAEVFDELLLGGEASEVGPIFTENDLGGIDADAIDGGEIAAGETVEGKTHGLLAAALEGFGFLFTADGRERKGVGLGRAHGVEVASDFGLVIGDTVVDEVEHEESLAKIEEMIVTPVAGEFLGDGGLAFMAAGIAEFSEDERIAFTGDNGADDGHAGGAVDLGNGAMNADVHLVEGFLHAAEPVGALGDEGGFGAGEGAELADAIVWAEAALE